MKKERHITIWDINC